MVTTGTTSAIRGGTGSDSTPANNVDSTYRRGSQGNGTLFSGLIDHKRGSQDAAAQARRASFAEQRPATGFLGTMWHNYIGHHAK